MNKMKFLLVLAFLVVLAAGAVVGMAVDRQLQKTAPTAPPPKQGHRPQGPSFPKLTDEQRTKMKEIWAPVDALRMERFRARSELDKKRTQDIQNILTPTQRDQYDAIQVRYREDVQKLESELQDAVKKAEEQTEAMMTPEQAKEYREWRQHAGPGRRGGGGPGRGGPGRGGRERSRPTTAPTTAPSNAV